MALTLSSVSYNFGWNNNSESSYQFWIQNWYLFRAAAGWLLCNWELPSITFVFWTSIRLVLAATGLNRSHSFHRTGFEFESMGFVSFGLVWSSKHCTVVLYWVWSALHEAGRIFRGWQPLTRLSSTHPAKEFNACKYFFLFVCFCNTSIAPTGLPLRAHFSAILVKKKGVKFDFGRA